MNCCDYDCNRAPGCPAGGLCYSQPGCKDAHCQGNPGTAKVAKVKRRTPKHPQPLRAVGASRVYLRHLAKWMLVAISTSVVASVVVGVMR